MLTPDYQKNTIVTQTLPPPHLTIRRFQQSDQAHVIDLWQRCDLLRPWNDPGKDIQRKMSDSPDGFFVGQLASGSNHRLIAAAMAGYDGHRGWVNYLAVDPDYSGNGYGRLMMDHIEGYLLSKNCPKINLQVRSSNADVIAFYKSLGYGEDAAVSLGKRLIPDD